MIFEPNSFFFLLTFIYLVSVTNKAVRDPESDPKHATAAGEPRAPW